MRHFFDKLVANIKAGDLATANVEKWEPKKLAKGGEGRRLHRGAARRAGDWIKIKDGKIDNYQWSCRPHGTGRRAIPPAISAPSRLSLMNTPMVDPAQPLEILRTIHSFDPCLACSTHVMSEDGQEMATVQVR